MHRARTRRSFESLESRRLLAANPVISEFMASNRGSLVDQFGESSDWIELYNAGDAAANLAGWYLTDDLADRKQWRFPSVTLEPGEYLVVFASGRDLSEPGEPLHANFRLSAEGESLGLVQPDGATIASQIEKYPSQLPDVSYGVSTQIAVTPLVGTSTEFEFVVPSDGSDDASWMMTDYATDERWLRAVAAANEPPTLGYERGNVLPDGGRYAEAVEADRPLGYWRLDEVRDPVAENLGLLGSAANGAFAGAVQGVKGVLPGAIDHASEFRQDNGHKIDVPFRAQLNPDDFTVELWARLDGGSGFRSPLTSRNSSPQEGFMLYASPGNTWEFWTGGGQARNWNIVRGPAVASGQWTHLVGTYDSQTQQQVLYVDGREAGRREAVYHPNRDHPLRIGGGATEGPGNFFFDGAIDEVAVYDYALAPQTIAAHYQLGRPLAPAMEERELLVADFANPAEAGLGPDASRLRLVGQSPQSPTLSNPDGWLRMGGGGTGSAVFVEELVELDFEHPLAIRTEALWEGGAAPDSDANAYFGLVALHRQGTDASGADRKGGLFAQAQPRSDRSVDLRFGFQTDSTHDVPDTFVITSSTTIQADLDASLPLQLELFIEGLDDRDEIRFLVSQGATIAETTTTIGDFRRALVTGSSAQQAFDVALGEIRDTPNLMNVGLISTRPFGAAAANVDMYNVLRVVALTPAEESNVADYDSVIDTDLGDTMFQSNSSLYLRLPFETDEGVSYDRLALSMRYDDGFVAYLNGQQIARRRAPDALQWNSGATAVHEDTEALLPEVIDVSVHAPLLTTGRNLLAIHALNRQADNVDFLVSARLDALRTTVDTHRYEYYLEPTAGTANTSDPARIGPVVDAVHQQPSRPSTSDPLVVTATLAAPSRTPAAVALYYRVMYDDHQSLPMRDDGVAPDQTADDGVYTAAIPPGVAEAGEMVRYYVTTSDADQNTFRSPHLAITQQDAQPEYFGTVIEDSSVETPLPVLMWFVPEPRWHVSGAGNNQNWTTASVYYEGEFYDNVRVRVRGLTTVNWAKPKFKFEFNDGDEFRYDPSQDPVNEFNLQSHYRETGAVSYMGETLAFQWLREIGVPAPLAFPLHVRQNGQFYSLASFVEQIDETFLERNGFDPDGSMYKANSAAVMSTLKPNPTPSHYRKVTRTDEPFDDLVELTNGVNGLLAIDRSTYLFDSINLPQVINDMAGNVIMPNHDRLTKNYYVHRDIHGNGEWSRFPWDMDQAFARFTVEHFASVLYGDSEHPQSPNPIHQNHLYDAILDTPITREMYLRRVRTLVDQYLATGYFEREVDDYFALLAVDAAQDNAKWRAGDIREGVDRIKSNLQFRRQQLEDEGLLPSSVELVTQSTLLSEDAPVTVIVPQDDQLGTRWTGGDEPFDDGNWRLGVSGVGFDNGNNPSYLSQINTLIEPRQVCDDCTSIYARYRFQGVDDLSSVDVLTLQMKYDDGFVAYLNGQPVVRQNALGDVTWNSVASSSSPETTEFSNFDISAFRELLRENENILAIHALNASRFSNDMLIRPRLLAGTRQTSPPRVEFGHVEVNPKSGNQDEEYIEIKNTGDISVDLSGWRIAGGIDYQFQPGTVIPANYTLYVSPDVNAFRARAAGPSGGQQRFVQGDYRGHLSNFGETLTLLSAVGDLIDTQTTEVAPSDVQKYLRVSELHYHPPGDGDAEYIELTNISDATTLDLAGVRISDGPSEPFVFAERTLEPGESVLVVNDLSTFVAAFPQVDPVHVAGAFEGRFDNGGEQIEVDDRSGSTVVQFRYQDQLPWPTAADGQGASLQLLNPNGDANDPRNWVAMAPTPGRLADVDGDLNQDGREDEADIQLLCRAIQAADNAWDLTDDGVVDQTDLLFLVRHALRSGVGDADLDGRFDSGDFVRVFQLGEYEDELAGNSTWSEGDWNCDGEFTSSDLVFAFQFGTFAAATTPPASRRS